MLLYCYVFYCPNKFCKSGCSYYLVDSYELDHVCDDLVSVICVLIDWLIDHIFSRVNTKLMFAVFALVLWFLSKSGQYVFLKVTILLQVFLIKAISDWNGLVTGVQDQFQVLFSIQLGSQIIYFSRFGCVLITIGLGVFVHQTFWLILMASLSLWKGWCCIGEE